MLGLVGVALVLAATAGLLGQVVLARHRAGAGADLAALAAADVLLGRATGDPCARAAEVAAAQGARLTRCTTDPLSRVAAVQVVVAPVGAAAPLGPARASARAGPQERDGEPGAG